MVATPINVVMGDFLGGMSWVVPAFELFRTGWWKPVEVSKISSYINMVKSEVFHKLFKWSATISESTVTTWASSLGQSHAAFCFPSGWAHSTSNAHLAWSRGIGRVEWTTVDPSGLNGTRQGSKKIRALKRFFCLHGIIFHIWFRQGPCLSSTG